MNGRAAVLVVALWLIVDLMLLRLASTPRPAATVIPADPTPWVMPATERTGPSGNPSQPTGAPRP